MRFIQGMVKVVSYEPVKLEFRVARTLPLTILVKSHVLSGDNATIIGG